MYDPVLGQAVIVCENDEYRVADVRDLMRLGVFGRSQIQSDPQYEVCAKMFTAGIAQIIQLKMWSGWRGRVETQLFGPYIGNKIPNVQQQKKQRRK
ncbi:hypothetical protein HanHA300_Chr02g0045351 [Helianthus annuus]|nr:hypothetical protein HanHA300_Chr02g0045351 [Helianthus annuus]KAJ0618067.1 hypothetical protein HanHA89_Chr02g0048991 [Helianthus annuus]